MNETLETHLRDELHDLVNAPPPASDRVRIAEARARGARTRRVRRAGAVAAVTAACVAVAGVSYSVQADGGTKTVHSPAAESARSGRQGEVRVLTITASFGWLPGGYRTYGTRALASPDDSPATTLSAAKPGYTDLQANAPIQLTADPHSTFSAVVVPVGPPVKGKAKATDTHGASGGVTVPRGPTVNGGQTIWMAQPGGKGAAQLAFQSVPNVWAVLTVQPDVTRDAQTIVKIAANARFARNPEPVRFPLRFRSTSQRFDTTELHTYTTESGAPGFGGTLVFKHPKGKETVWVDVYPATMKRHTVPTLGKESLGNYSEVTVGAYRVQVLVDGPPDGTSMADDFVSRVGKATVLPQNQQTTNPFA